MARKDVRAGEPVGLTPPEEADEADLPLDIEALYAPVGSLPVHGETATIMAEQLVRLHYRPVDIDDAFSARVFSRYLKLLDGQRLHFLRHEVARLNDFRYTLDDELRRFSVEQGFEIYNRYHRRRLERIIYAINRVENHIPEMDFTLDETYGDREDAPYPETTAELHEIWRLWVKSSVLNLKLAGDDDEEIKEKLSRRFRNQLSNALKVNERDVFQTYLSAVSGVVDPHTSYFSPRNAENFNMNMSLSLQGIGAQLSLEDEYTRIVSIIPGGPADRGGELKAGDRIVGVAQGAEGGYFNDVVGMRLDDVVDQIRGEKGTVVRLRIIPADAVSEATTAVVSITRDVVKLEDQAAKKEVIELSYNDVNYRIGIIDLPLFYFDFIEAANGQRDYNSSVGDVRRLLEELKAEQVDAVIMDLRNNSGGSLSEASDMVGLFIETGPTVLVRNAGRGNGNDIVNTLRDEDSRVAYDGPLAVLVNRGSASSSEIFAGAIQDYQRGIVLGGQTFGKGTVQELIGLNYGQLKITRAQFYRISGASTQSRGVIPDIPLPDIYQASDDIGEDNLENAMPWDEIPQMSMLSRYPPYLPIQALLPELTARHEARAAESPDIIYLNGLIERTRQQREQREFPLNEAAAKEQRKMRRRAEFDADNRRREAKGLSLREWVDEDEPAVETADAGGADDETESLATPEEAEEAERLEEEDEDDPLLLETGRVLADFIALTSRPVR